MTPLRDAAGVVNVTDGPVSVAPSPVEHGRSHAAALTATVERIPRVLSERRAGEEISTQPSIEVVAQLRIACR